MSGAAWRVEASGLAITTGHDALGERGEVGGDRPWRRWQYGAEPDAAPGEEGGPFACVGDGASLDSEADAAKPREIEVEESVHWGRGSWVVRRRSDFR